VLFLLMRTKIVDQNKLCMLCIVISTYHIKFCIYNVITNMVVKHRNSLFGYSKCW